MPKNVEWGRLSDYRLKSGWVLHESGQHLDAVFNFQQAIEFMLKAVIASEGLSTPPKTHDLLELAALGKIPADAPQRRILDEVHDVSVPLRYPDNLDEALEAYTYEEVERIGKETEAFIQWLKRRPS